jgi:sugar phosphate isomerase/epimerase
MQLGGTNFGYLNAYSLDDSLVHLASVGLKVVELGLAPPHIDLDEIGEPACRQLRHRIEALGLKCSSVNVAELNLISQNSGVAGLTMRHYGRAMQVAAELDCPTLVVVPGRQHPLRPMPHALAMEQFLPRLDRLLREAEKHRMVLALETVPFGFLETAQALFELTARLGHPLLRIVLDCANMFMVEDPALGVHAAPGRIQVCHVSDAWKRKWAHTSIGRGEVDIPAFKQALDAVGYQGVTIYELMDNEDPIPRLAHDLRALQTMGWSFDA